MTGTFRTAALVLLYWAATGAQADGPAPATATEVSAAQPLFAVVNGTVISANEYQAAYRASVREKFYHGQPREEDAAGFRREVGESLINRVLLLEEADRRGIRPQAEQVREAIAAIDQRYRNNEQWNKDRTSVLPGLVRQLEQRSVLEQLERSVRAVTVPTAEELARYYRDHAALFTEPEQLRLSLILLKVDPSSPEEAWTRALDQGRAIRERVLAGADFAAEARRSSGDITAPQGGDMGYVHRGMLAPAVHAELDPLGPDMISKPLRILEGVALFRLVERKPSRLISLDEARSRAADLLRRERAESNWSGLIATLRKAAVINLDQSRFPEFVSFRQAVGRPDAALNTQ